MNKKWPKDYSDEEIRDIIAEGNSIKANGMKNWVESGMTELGLRQKDSQEKSNKKIFKLSIAILIVSILGLFISIFFNL